MSENKFQKNTTVGQKITTPQPNFTWKAFFENSSVYFFYQMSYLLFAFVVTFFEVNPFFKYKKNKKKESFKYEFGKIFLKEGYVDYLYQYNFFNEFFLFCLSLQYKLNKFETHRINYRLNFFKKGFYMLYNNIPSSKTFYKNMLSIYVSGFSYFFSFFSKWFLPFTLLVLFIYFSVIVKSLPFNKVLFVWMSIFMVVYWIISGFVFFFKKYQYSKFTSVVQRFWKRSLILFWLIEGSVLLVFIYLTLNSTNYLYNVVDQTQIFKTHLFSWKIFLLKIFPTTLLLLLTYLFLLNNKWQPLNKNILLLTTITILLVYITWIEFYQYYHLINYYSTLVWSFEPLDKFWSIKNDLKKTSQTNHLVSLLLILKFWHVLFIVGTWIFFVLRSEESGRSRYPLIAANFLNFVMLYILTWVYMYPWFKWFFRRYFTYTYKWFYENNRSLGLRLLFNDLRLLFIALSDYSYKLNNYFFLISYKSTLFFNIKFSDSLYGFVDFNKKFYSQEIISSAIQSFTQDDMAALSLVNRFVSRIFDLGDSIWSFFFYEWVLSFELYEMRSL